MNFLVKTIIIPIVFAVLMVIILYEPNMDHSDKQDGVSFDLSLVQLEHLDQLDSISANILESGKKEMAQHKVIFAGIIRDNLKRLPTSIQHIEYLGKAFNDYRVILFENDSTDGTKLALNNWQESNSKIRIISKDFSIKKRPNHKFMAEARNQYLKALKESQYADFDLLIILDMDMAYGIDIRAIEDSFSKIDQWDAVCSNGISNHDHKMYDAFSFRSEEFPWTSQEWQKICSENNPLNPWTKICNNGQNYSKGIIIDNLSFIVGWQKETRLYWLLIMPQIQKAYPVNSSLIPVSSCFGGLAIYKRDFISDCFYDSIENDCEHVIFHQCIKKHNGKMFLNPNQMIRYTHYQP